MKNCIKLDGKPWWDPVTVCNVRNKLDNFSAGERAGISHRGGDWETSGESQGLRLLLLSQR